MDARTVAEIQERRRALRADFIGCPRQDRCVRPCGDCVTINAADFINLDT